MYLNPNNESGKKFIDDFYNGQKKFKIVSLIAVIMFVFLCFLSFQGKLTIDILLIATAIYLSMITWVVFNESKVMINRMVILEEQLGKIQSERLREKIEKEKI